MEKKPWYQSKTLWFNVLAFVVAVAANYGYSGELPGQWQQFVIVAVTLINFILRFVTKQPIV